MYIYIYIYTEQQKKPQVPKKRNFRTKETQVPKKRNFRIVTNLMLEKMMVK